MKKLALALLLTLFILPAQAQHNTQDTDKIGVLRYQMNGKKTKELTTWKALKLNKRDLKQLNYGLSKFKAGFEYEKFRVGFLRMGPQNLVAATLYGDHGSTLVLDFFQSRWCYTYIDGDDLPNATCKGF